MSTLLRKLKSFFVYDASNSSNSTLDKTSGCDGNMFKVVSSYLKLDHNPEDDWLIVDSIGDGAFGQIFKTEHKRSKRFAALKQVAVDDEDEVEEYCSEVKVLCRVKHRNIICLLEACYYDSKIWMFLEYCEIGSMDSIMQELERPLDQSQISCVVTQLCHALTYLHEEVAIIHRDIKSANVLMNSDACVKLADFGVSAICERDKRRNSFIGSPYWMAPEVISCETNKQDAYDFMADIWSLGIMSIEMAQMDPPWKEVNPSRVTLKILRNSPPTLDEPSKWSPEFKDFLSRCLKKNPKERESASTLLKHKFLQSFGRDLGPLKELIAEVNAEVKVECTDIEEEEEDENEGNGDDDNDDDGGDEGQLTTNDLYDLERKYFPSIIISTNIDEEMAKRSPDPEAPPPDIAMTTTTVTSASTTKANSNFHQSASTFVSKKAAGDYKLDEDKSASLIGPNPWECRPDDRDKHVLIGSSLNQLNDSKYGNEKEIVVKNKALTAQQQQQSRFSKDPKSPPSKQQDSKVLIANDNFSFGQSSLGSRSSDFPLNFSSIGKEARANQKKGVYNTSDKQHQQFGNVKEGLKVALFGALASKQRLIGWSEKEGKVLQAYNGGRGIQFHRDDDSNDGDVSSVAMTTVIDDDDDEDDDDDDDDRLKAPDSKEDSFKREEPRYKSLTKTRVYTYEGRPFTSQMSKVISQGQEERSRLDRHNKKMNMRAMQLLQLVENKRRKNLVHHFKKQTRDLQRNFRTNVKKCLKCYNEDLERLTRTHKQSIIKVQLHHDQEFNEVHKKVKVQQEKDYKSLKLMLRMELKRLKHEFTGTPLVDGKIVMATIDRKEMENLEVMRTYMVRQKEQMSRMINQVKFKHQVQQANMESGFMVQKHDLYRACEGAIWKLEEGHLLHKKQLVIEQLRQMHDLQLEQTRIRYNQEMEQLVKSQASCKTDLSRKHEEEERFLSRQLKYNKRQRTIIFKEALRAKVATRVRKDDPKIRSTGRKADDEYDDDGANGGDSGYMSLENKQIKEFERNERRRVDETFKHLRLRHKNETREFQLHCSEEVQELNRMLQERENQLELSLVERLKEEESKDGQENVRWQQSLTTRKRTLEEELERQKNQQERFFRNILRGYSSSHHQERRFFETFDRNFEHRIDGRFVSDSTNHKFNSLDLHHSPSPHGMMPFQGHWKEYGGGPTLPLGQITNSPLYKSTPNFINYWSGLDGDISSSGDDDDPNNGRIDEWFERRRKGRRSEVARICSLRQESSDRFDDDEMSTCL